MTSRMLAMGLVALGVACSSGSTGSTGASDGAAPSKCDSITQEIHDAAVKRGYDGNHDGVPDSVGICEDTDPAIVHDFGAACTSLRNCNAGH